MAKVKISKILRELLGLLRVTVRICGSVPSSLTWVTQTTESSFNVWSQCTIFSNSYCHFFTVLSSLYLNIYPEKKNPKSSFAIISHNLRLSSLQRIIFKWTVKSQGLEGCLDAAWSLIAFLNYGPPALLSSQAVMSWNTFKCAPWRWSDYQELPLSTPQQ